MKKVNNQNPLKTFNDNYATRAKKVTEGNNKLVKAQVGISKNDSITYAKNRERVKRYLTDPINANGKSGFNFGKGSNANPEAYKEGNDTTNMKWIHFEKHGPGTKVGVQVGPSNNDYRLKKTGGQTKSKKK
jgi:hypothetical protein